MPSQESPNSGDQVSCQSGGDLWSLSGGCTCTCPLAPSCCPFSSLDGFSEFAFSPCGHAASCHSSKSLMCQPLAASLFTSNLWLLMSSGLRNQPRYLKLCIKESWTVAEASGTLLQSSMLPSAGALWSLWLPGRDITRPFVICSGYWLAVSRHSQMQRPSVNWP